MNILEFNEVAYINEEKRILVDISIEIKRNDYISIIGPSGSGKSTLLKLCNNLISPSKGSILYRAKNVLEYDSLEIRKEIAYCSQTPYLFGVTVMDNLSYPYNIRNEKPDINRIDYLFNSFKIREEFKSEKVINLSGGEKQRIALIRSLLYTPEILLLDEITSALDSENTAIVEGVINSLHDDGVTILWVTHNQSQSRRYANKLLTIENGNNKSLEVLK